MNEIKAGIITIGDELLIGETVDTNASWIAKELDHVGVNVCRIYTISDDEKEVHIHLKKMLEDLQLILITGGLGPTHDDITKHALCSFFKDKLVFDEAVFVHLEKMMNKFGKKVSDMNRTQAFVPSTSKSLLNMHGTAPGMQFSFEDKVVISMPGVPFEMKNMMREYVLPTVVKRGVGERKFHRQLKTFGIAEADLALKLEPVISSLDKLSKVAFLPSPGVVKIRITVKRNLESDAHHEISRIEKEILNLVKSHCFGFESDTMESVVGLMLIDKRKTLSTAESCTGGKLASIITSISGSSEYFKGAIVSYDNEIKMNQLNVSSSTLKKHGAVSENVVMEMASGVRALMKTDYALTTSGIAGPTGGTSEKPVGTIWIALASSKDVITKKLQLGFNRETNISLTAVHCLNLLRKELQNNI